MSATTDDSMPTPERIFGTLNAYQQTAALKTAIELDVFTAIGQGTNTTATLAQKCQASERGIRTLCDFLVIYGFLEKNGHSYELTRDAAIFLNKKSPAYLGSAVNFLTSAGIDGRFQGFDGHRTQWRLAARRRHHHRSR